MKSYTLSGAAAHWIDGFSRAVTLLFIGGDLFMASAAIKLISVDITTVTVPSSAIGV